MVNDFYATVIAKQHTAELRDRADQYRRAKTLRQARRAQQCASSIHDRPAETRVRNTIRRVLRARFSLPVGRTESAEPDIGPQAPTEPISADKDRTCVHL